MSNTKVEERNYDFICPVQILRKAYSFPDKLRIQSPINNGHQSTQEDYRRLLPSVIKEVSTQSEFARFAQKCVFN
jgi:hypothetical protein